MAPLQSPGMICCVSSLTVCQIFGNRSVKFSYATDNLSRSDGISFCLCCTNLLIAEVSKFCILDVAMIFIFLAYLKDIALG